MSGDNTIPRGENLERVKRQRDAAEAAIEALSPMLAPDWEIVECVIKEQNDG